MEQVNLPKTAEDILAKLKNEKRRYIQFHFSNIAGELRGMEEAADLIPKIAKNGLSVDGSSVGVVDVNASDIRLIPDWTTYASYQAGGEIIDRVLCDIHYRGQKHPACVRTAMKETIEHCKSLGYEPHMFGEIEYYYLNQDRTPHDHAGYCSLPPEDKAQGIRHETGEALEKCGCLVKRIHHENGPGQNEVELKICPAMKNADDLITSMAVIRSVAGRHNLLTDYMPKPLAGEAGSGFHQHFALFDVKTGENIFAAPWVDGVRPKELLSPRGKSFTAGLLEHAEEITAVFAMHQQSFERLEPGHEAPAFVCWGSSNRTALVRIPDPSEPSDTRIEYRGGDFAGSSYLLCAVLLAAGLDGLERNLKCAPEVTANADHFTDEELKRLNIRRIPKSEEELKKVLQTSTWLRKIFSEPLLNYLINKKKH